MSDSFYRVLTMWIVDIVLNCKGGDNLTSFLAIFTGGILSGFVIYAFFHEDKWIAWEDKHLIPPFRRLCARIRRSIVKAMKSNARFMEWLNKPQKHGKPDDDFITSQIKVFRDTWR